MVGRAEYDLWWQMTKNTAQFDRLEYVRPQKHLRYVSFENVILFWLISVNVDFDFGSQKHPHSLKMKYNTQTETVVNMNEWKARAAEPSSHDEKGCSHKSCDQLKCSH